MNKIEQLTNIKLRLISLALDACKAGSVRLSDNLISKVYGNKSFKNDM
ncbi:hypothetical protein JEZ13_04165 [bacterium]|nr:hypothetical protein [bacterium]MBI9072945.1 hypothetical protein [Melioribacteraceae bacterium]